MRNAATGYPMRELLSCRMPVLPRTVDCPFLPQKLRLAIGARGMVKTNPSRSTFELAAADDTSQTCRLLACGESHHSKDAAA